MNNIDFSITFCLIIYRKLNIYDDSLETLKNMSETLINIQEELQPPQTQEEQQQEQQDQQQQEGNPTYNPDIYSGGMDDLELLLYNNPDLRT